MLICPLWFDFPDAWPVTRRIYVIFLIHIRNLESVLTNDGKVSPISIIEVQIQFFQFRENISLNLRLIKRKIREKIGKSCLYDNLIILDLKNGRQSKFSIERSLDWFVRWVYSTGQIEWSMDPSRTFRVVKENFK